MTATETKSRPILFSAPMIRAILAGKKTQTRRVVGESSDPAGVLAQAVCQCHADQSWIAWWGMNGKKNWQEQTDYLYPNGGGFACPYGVPGDTLWVRETWAMRCTRNFPPRGPRMFWKGEWLNGDSWILHHDGIPKEYVYRADEKDKPPFWRPSIHMPRGASRITLEITHVKVERVQEISRDDARDEGIPEYGHEFREGMTEQQLDEWRNRSTVENFAALWDSINGKRPGCSWEANPWVWVIGFRVTEPVNCVAGKDVDHG